MNQNNDKLKIFLKTYLITVWYLIIAVASVVVLLTNNSSDYFFVIQGLIYSWLLMLVVSAAQIVIQKTRVAGFVNLSIVFVTVILMGYFLVSNVSNAPAFSQYLKNNLMEFPGFDPSSVSDPSECEAITNTGARDVCFSIVSVRLKDPTICEELRVSRGKDICYNNVAEAVEDKSICDSISDSLIRNECLEVFES